MHTPMLRSTHLLTHRCDLSLKNKFVSSFWKGNLPLQLLFLNIRTGLYHHILMIYLQLHAISIILNCQCDWIYLAKSKYRLTIFIFSGSQIWTKISHCAKNVKPPVSFTRNLKREILSNLLLLSKLVGIQNKP